MSKLLTRDGNLEGVVRRTLTSGLLSLWQEPLGYWSAYRNHHTILLRDGRPAAFRTADQAKTAVDAHLCDELGKPSTDGFEWFSMA